jgi:hypothetical protein
MPPHQHGEGVLIAPRPEAFQTFAVAEIARLLFTSKTMKVLQNR